MKIEKTSKEIKPLGNYVFIKGMENPYEKKMTDSGLYLPKGLAHEQADGSGRIQQMEEIIKYGIIEEVGSEVKTLQVGDGVYFDVRSIRPIPFGTIGVMHINENNILAYVR
jgi:co-chaperonin GroES (HSP10)